MDNIYVTKSVLPPLAEYLSYLEDIWESGHLTNNGPCVQMLERALATEFGVKHALLVSNATIGIQLAIKGLNIKGAILTTPFSFVATSSTIVWEGCEVLFADIDADTLCLSPDQISARMHSGVSAIMATHVFGNPCDTAAIGLLAKEYNVPVIYDAAHAYGVDLKGKSIMGCGDVSVLSLHATKLFHAVEGGVITTNDDELAARLSYMRNFGFDGPEAYQGVGINAKMSEFHAAMGLCLHKRMPAIIEARMERVERYDQHFKGVSQIQKIRWNSEASKNAAYYPIIVPSEVDVLAIVHALGEIQIFARRYFYPSLSDLPYVCTEAMPVAEDIAKRILCLPLYPDLALDDVDRIAAVLITQLRK